MKKAIDIKQVKFFLWVGFAFLLVNLFGDLRRNPGTFLHRSANHIWLVSYLIVINFILFGYTLPFIRSGKYTFGKIVITLLLFFAYFILYSLGLYAWRYIGIQLHIYTPFRISLKSNRQN